MAETRHIHITGASGAGVTTLGRALADRLGCPHYDTDDYYWAPTDPPFRLKREISERLRLLNERLTPTSPWVISGSLDGWGDPLIPLFDLVIFLSVPTEIRLRRLRAREAQRFGDAAIAPNGRLHQQHEAFLEWAAAYETGNLLGRSRPRHEAWLAGLPCAVLRLEGVQSTESVIETIVANSLSACQTFRSNNPE